MPQKLPWYPADGDQFDWAMRTYRNWHPEDAESYLMVCPSLNRVRSQHSYPVFCPDGEDPGFVGIDLAGV